MGISLGTIKSNSAVKFMGRGFVNCTFTTAPSFIFKNLLSNPVSFFTSPLLLVFHFAGKSPMASFSKLS